MRPIASGLFAALAVTAAVRFGGGEVVEDFESTAAGELPKGFAAAVAVEPGPPGSTPVQGKLAKWAVVDEPSRRGKHVLKLVESKNRNAVYNLFLRDEKAPADLSVSVRLRPDAGLEDRGGGVIWRMVDEQNYYLARWNPLEKTVCVYRVVKGRRITLQFVPVAGVSGEWHVLKASMKGRVITISFDDAKALSLPDDTWKEAGRIGLWTRSDAQSSFDDLVVAPAE
jgi:hypothetical protein